MTKTRSVHRKHAGKGKPFGPARPASPAALTAGAVLAGVGACASLLLALQYLGTVHLPGFAPGGWCTQPGVIAWDRIRSGGFEWPTSYIGLAYFLAVLAAWLAARGAVPRALRYLVRFGALVSLGYVIVIVVTAKACPYCVAVHVGNFAFWLVMEVARTRPTPARISTITAGGVFAVVTIALGVAHARHRAPASAQAESDRGGTVQATTAPSKPEPVAPAASQAATEGAFTGRYPVGPAEAPIRIVVFTGYQCTDCATVEKQLEQLRATRNDVSISIKHFVFNSDCNPYVLRSLHVNGCWAARAAEAAGKLWGPEGFWKMNVWLFNHSGLFDSIQELEAGVRELGYDPAGFVAAMQGEDTLRAILFDEEEAEQLGLFFTPMVFINGVELRGWYATNAVIRAVEQVAASKPPPRSATFDRPPSALEKTIADWREQPQLVLPSGKHARTMGPAEARIKVVLWGDYQEAGTTEADAIIRTFAAGRDDVQYTYRHYPFNSECNPQLQEQRHPNACRAARAAEAAGRLGGDAGFWKMHVWLMENRLQFNDATLRAAVAQMGLSVGVFFGTLEQSDLQDNILDDVVAGTQLPQLRLGAPTGVFSIPTIFVNGRYVLRWKLGDKPVLGDILAESAK